MATLGSTEIEVVTPLDGDEIKAGIANIIAEAVHERLNKIGYLYGQAYPKFKAEIAIMIELENFGLSQKVTTTASASNLAPGEVVGENDVVTLEVDIPFTPPNQFRRENGLDVPTMSPSRPSSEPEAQIFKAKRGRPARAK